MPTPQTSSQYAFDGIVPGMTWDDLMKGMQQYTSNDLLQYGNAHGTVGGIPVYERKAQTNIGQNSGEGQGFQTPTFSDDPSLTTYTSPDLGNGTHNVYSRNPDGTVQSHNETINNDSWWDSSGLPMLASLAFGGAALGAGAAGIGVSGAGAGAANVGAGLGSLNLPGAAGAAGGFGAGATSVATGGLGDYMPYQQGGGFQNVGAPPAGAVSFDPSMNGWVMGDGSFVGAGAGGVAEQLPGVAVSASAGGIPSWATALGLGGAAAGAGAALGGLGGGGGSSGTGAMDQTGSEGSNLSNNGGSSPTTSQILQALKTGGSALQQLFGGGGNGSSGSGSGGGLNLAGLLQGLGQTAGGILSAQEQKALGDKIVKTVDPFNQYRQQYAGQLNGLVQSPGYADKFSPTNVKDYLAQNTPQGALAGLNAYQTNPNVANSFATMNGLNGANGTDYNALNGIGTQYANLLKDPNQIFNDTAYKAQTAQGTEALNRTLASRGQTSSGNEMQALQDYGTANSAQYYNNRLSQLGTGYNQNIGALGQQFNQAQSAAGANLARDSQQYGQTYNTANANLQAQNLGYNQQSGLFGQGLAGNQAQYGQLAQMSGLSQANLGAAGMALSQQYGNVQNAYGQAGQGLFGTGAAGSGLLGQLGSGLSSLFGGSSGSSSAPDTSWLSDIFGTGSGTPQTFSGMTTDTGNSFLNALNGYGMTTNGGVDPISLFGWS